MAGHEVVGVYGGRPAAEIARGVLVANGIQADLIADDDGGLAPVAALTEGVRIIVRADRAAEAKELLAAARVPEAEGPRGQHPGSAVRLTAAVLVILVVVAIIYEVAQAL